MQGCFIVVLQYSYKIVRLPLGFALVFESNNAAYTAEQHLVNFRVFFCFFVELALCRISNLFLYYLLIDNDQKETSLKYNALRQLWLFCSWRN